MNERERWLATMHFQPVDHIPDEEMGHWSDTLHVWHSQGLPRAIKDREQAARHFGFARREWLPVQVGLLPGFRTRTIKKDGLHKIVRDGDGALSVWPAKGLATIPHYLRFAIACREDWHRLKAERLVPGTTGRYPADWQARTAEWTHRDYPLGIRAGSIYGIIRNWMGFERAALTWYDDPDWMEEMVEHLTQLILATMEQALRDVQVDCAIIWEDIAFNNGPMISPALFRRVLLPRYQRITGLLRRYGVDVIYVDCDGDINLLVEPWLEAGVNCMFPLEVRAGTDPVALRQRYGKRVLLMGGVDKMRLREGRAAIRQEIARVENTVADGGYIPHVDHRCPPDVSYQDYLYYLQVKRSAFAIPAPDPTS